MFANEKTELKWGEFDFFDWNALINITIHALNMKKIMIFC